MADNGLACMMKDDDAIACATKRCWGSQLSILHLSLEAYRGGDEARDKLAFGPGQPVVRNPGQGRRRGCEERRGMDLRRASGFFGPHWRELWRLQVYWESSGHTKTVLGPVGPERLI